MVLIVKGYYVDKLFAGEKVKYVYILLKVHSSYITGDKEAMWDV